MKLPIILYFIKSAVPTIDDQIEAYDIKGEIRFRNVSLMHKTTSSCLEKCDGVAGCVPEEYQVKPTAAEAVAEFEKRFHERVNALKVKTKPAAANLVDWTPN